MAAILYTLLFIMGGAAIIRMQLPGKSPLMRAIDLSSLAALRAFIN